MSTEITTAFVQQYRSNLIHLSQQKESRLRNAVRVKENVTGKQVFFDRLGTVSMVQLTSRHADTVQTDTPHSRRMASLAPYTISDLIDDPDQIRTLISPANDYAKAQANAIGRQQDDIIIAAALGTAATGETGSGSQALPAGQKINVQLGGGGADDYLNLDKVLEAKRLLDASEVEDDNRYLVYNALQLSKVLALEKFTSIDYNTQRALVEGRMPQFLGFTWIHSERLTTDSSSNTQVLAFQGDGIGLGIGRLRETRITEESTKNYATQVWSYLDMGSVRIVDATVIEIACKPS
jgi:hypothetical protein